jgi:hypothetical protein
MSAVDYAVVQAVKEHAAGNYRGALKLLRPFLLAREKLSLQQELAVVGVASGCNRYLCDFKAALPLAQRVMVLEQQLAGPRSLGHARALMQLCMVQNGLKDFVAASKAIKEALAIMELQRHEGTGRCCWRWAGWTGSRGSTKRRWPSTTRLRLSWYSTRKGTSTLCAPQRHGQLLHGYAPMERGCRLLQGGS